jgi:hypothetical protein
VEPYEIQKYVKSRGYLCKNDFLLYHKALHSGTIFNFYHVPQFLEKELVKLGPKNLSQGRYADILVKVHLLAGEDRLLLCHIEVQGRPVDNFEARLFQYTYRIFDRFGSFPLSLVVLTDNEPEFLPRAFEDVLPVRRVRVEFLVAKLLYWKGREAELESSGNPFALVALTQLEVNSLCRRKEYRSAGGPDRDLLRFELKKRLTLKLMERGFYEEKIESLLIFLSWMLQLPKSLELRFDREINEETGGEIMPYMTRWEREGLKRGIREGKREGRAAGFNEGLVKDKRGVLTRQLERKFGLLEEEKALIDECEDLEALDAALDEILFAENKEEVLELLNQPT